LDHENCEIKQKDTKFSFGKGETKMIKRIVLGALLVGLIGVLVAGAIIRTVDNTENVAEARGLGHDSSFGGDTEERGQGYGAAGRGQGQGGYGGEGRSDAPGDGTGTGQAQVDEWLTLQGSVTAVDADTLVVQTGSGEVIIENRPWWTAQEQSFSAQVGDQVTLVGFYEDEEFEVGQIRNDTTGQTVSIRDESGRPLWAGRGRRGG
jgi:hypothetical protein